MARIVEKQEEHIRKMQEEHIRKMQLLLEEARGVLNLPSSPSTATEESYESAEEDKEK